MIDQILKQFDLPTLEVVTGLDATFLYGETPTSPMHVGGIIVVEGSLQFEEFKAILMSRIHQMPKLRKKLMYVPFSIDYPYWVDDPNFDIDMHLEHIALPKPGGWKQMRKLASKVLSEPLDHSKPLWSFTFVEGLDTLSQVKPGSVAIISKMHHVAIDGMAGAGMLAVLCDMSPNATKPAAPKPYRPKKLPSDISLIMKSTASFAKRPLKFPRLIKDTLSATLKAGFLTRAQHLDLPTAPFTAPPTPFNKIISAQRKWNTSILSLERVKKLKTIMGTTLNDIILSICAGALRKYLLEKDKLPAKSLVAMVPVSTRSKSDTSNTGNQLSNMLVQLATDIEDPIERLEAIYENTIRGKTYQNATGAKTLSNIAESVPFGIANQAARLYSRYNIAKMHKPVFNVVITNVPGPQIPLYLGGKKINSIMAAAPIIDGMGLIISVLSYNGNITISPTSDKKSMPDLNLFSDFVLQSANELEREILALESSKKKKSKLKKSHPVTPRSDIFFEKFRTYLKEHPKSFKAKTGTFQFLVKGPVAANWTISLNKAPGGVRRSKSKSANTTFTVQDKHLMSVYNGKIDMETAIIQGKIIATGDKKKVDDFVALCNKVLE